MSVYIKLVLYALGPARTILCGGAGGVALWVSIFPADVVKSRIQVQAVSGVPPTFRAMFLKILRQEGGSIFLNFVFAAYLLFNGHSSSS